jgi:hypothetical protein
MATCASAAEGGHLDVLKWARENGCPWDEETCDERGEGRPPRDVEVGARERLPVGQETCEKAALGGHLEVLSGRARTAARGKVDLL